jgi:hypothetical protein
MGTQNGNITNFNLILQPHETNKNDFKKFAHPAARAVLVSQLTQFSLLNSQF